MKSPRRFFFALGICLLPLSATLHAESALTPVLRDRVDAAAREVLAITGVPSASLAVVTDGQIAYLQAYGDASVESRRPARPEMRYSIGSIRHPCRRGLDPAVARAHLRLPGLLAAGLRAAVHAA